MTVLDPMLLKFTAAAEREGCHVSDITPLNAVYLRVQNVTETAQSSLKLQTNNIQPRLTL